MSQYRNMQNQGHSVFPKSPLPGREGEGRGIAERADMPMRDMESHKPPQYTKMGIRATSQEYRSDSAGRRQVSWQQVVYASRGRESGSPNPGCGRQPTGSSRNAPLRALVHHQYGGASVCIRQPHRLLSYADLLVLRCAHGAA